MAKLENHPTEHELSAFALGDLPPEVADRVEQHVSECDSCCETIVSLSSDDTFLGLLQKANAESKRTPETVAFDESNSGRESIPAPLLAHPRYEIVQLVGRGGMGRVYRARHRVMDRVVALKVIHREWVTRQEAVDRFHREMTTAASLDHRNIVTAYDAEQAEGLHFLVMEYVDGEDLAQTVGQQGALSVAQACEYVRQVAEGLRYAHDSGMVHRDIKPHNLIVTKQNVVKILDFGLASLAPQVVVGDSIQEDADGKLTIAGTIMGTPDFISPEQAADARNVDGRSDIYSLGMTLYYLLAGKVPFSEGTAAEKLKLHTEAEPTPLSAFRDDITPELEAVVARMTAKDPARRFQTPQEVVTALQPLAEVKSLAAASKSARLTTGSLAVWLCVVVAVAAIVYSGLFFLQRGERLAAADYKQLTTFLQTGQSEEFSGNIVDRLLRSPEGRKYLRKLDAENAKFAYTEGEFIHGYTSVVMYAYDDLDATPHPELMVKGWRFGTVGSTTRAIHRAVTLESIRFDNAPDHTCRAILEYVTTQRSELGTLGGLQPQSQYTSSILLDDLLDGGADLPDLWAGGTFVRKASRAFGSEADSQPDNLSAAPSLKLTSRVVQEGSAGLPDTYSWTLSGQGVGRMTVRMWLAQNGKAEVAQEFDFVELPLAFGNEIRLAVKDSAVDVDQRRSINATLYVESPTSSRSQQTNADRGISVQVKAPFSSDREQAEVSSISGGDSHLLLAKGYWDGDLSYEDSLEHMIASTDGGKATFIFVTLDWSPLDPTLARQRRSASSASAKTPEAKLLERLLERERHPLDELTDLICAAAGVQAEQWEQFARSPTAAGDSIQGMPLSWALMTLETTEPLTTSEQDEFQWLSEEVVSPEVLHESMSATRDLGYYSLVQHERISDHQFIVATVDGRTATLDGNFHFAVPGLCEGNLRYVAQVDENSDLEIIQFTLPQRDLAFTLDREGIWQKAEIKTDDSKLVTRLRGAHGNEVTRVVAALCRAAGVPADQWLAAAKSPTGSMAGIKGDPLSVVMPRELMTIREGTVSKPMEMHGAMALSAAQGYYSVLQPQYITDLTYQVRGVGENTAKLKGRVHFNGLGLYAGKVDFVAEAVSLEESDEFSVNVLEFSFPELSIIVQNQNGLWVKYTEEADAKDAFAADFCFAHVPANAQEVYGFSPRRLSENERFSRLVSTLNEKARGLGAISFDARLEQAMWVRLPENELGDEPLIVILTVAEGTVLDFARDRFDAEMLPVDADDITWRELATEVPLKIDGTYFLQFVDEQTLVLGGKEALSAYEELSNQPRDDAYLAAVFALNKHEHQVFMLAKSMDQKYLTQLAVGSVESTPIPMLMQFLPVLTDSSYITGSLSLGDAPRVALVSRLVGQEKQDGVHAAMDGLASQLVDLVAGLPANQQTLDGNGMPMLTPVTKNLLMSALKGAEVQDLSENETRLVIALDGINEQLQPFLENLLDELSNRETMYEAESRERLKRITEAFVSFNEKYGYLPAVKTRVPGAKYPMSWRVAILPFVGEDEIFESYNLDEPWDSESNRKLLDSMPDIFRHPTQQQNVGKTNFVTIAGPSTATGDGSKPVVLEELKAEGDGSLLMVAESLARIPWTSPQDPLLDSSNPVPALGGINPSGLFLAATAEGVVLEVPADLEADLLNALFTRNAAEILDASNGQNPADAEPAANDESTPADRPVDVPN